MSCYQEITCPSCKSNQIGKSGRNAGGEPRYRCHNPLDLHSELPIPSLPGKD